MAKIEFTNPQLTSPAWAGDALDAINLLPGGAKVTPADFTADAKGRKHIPAGTPLGRTYAERDAGTGFGPAATTDEELYLLAFDVTDAVMNSDCELYRHGRIVKENFLPDYATMASGIKDAIRTKYQCIKGVV